MQDQANRQPAGQVAPFRLRCEYLKDPLGIDEPNPRLSWCIGDSRPAELQTAYHLIAASHPDLLDMDEGDLWDSGRVEGRKTALVEYDGKPLVSGRSVWWKVRCYDSDGLPGPWSTAAFFEAGLLEADDWHGHWLSAGLQGSRNAAVPVPLFGRRFELSLPIRRARLHVAARGQVVIQLNGRILGQQAQAPNWVDYQRRVEYLTFDVSKELLVGANRLALLLGDGWYAGDPGTGARQQYGEKPSFIAELKVTLADGRDFRLASDGSWRWQPSWILSSDPTRGENVDGTRARTDWLGDGPETTGWYPVEVGSKVADQPQQLTAATLLPSRREIPEAAERLRWQEAECRLLFAFPRLLAGRARVSMVVPDGGVVRIRYGLALDEAGNLLHSGEDVCVARGDESGESFEATFSNHGFRYVEVSGDVFREDSVAVSAVAIAQPLTGTSKLIADHPRINELRELMMEQLSRTQQSVSMAGMRREDRLGNAAAFGATAGALLTHLDGAALTLRWLRDMCDAQFPEGGFPAVVPAPPGEEALCAEGPAGSSAAFVEVLWQLFRHCGDRRLLRRYFPAVKQLLAGSMAASRDLIPVDLEGDGRYPADLLATAWLYRSVRLGSRIAGVLGNLSDLEDFEEQASHVRSAFRRHFVTRNGRVIGDDAATYALTLSFGLLDRTEQQSARQMLVELVGRALKAGPDAMKSLLETPCLLPVLTEQGRLDLAYRLVLEASFRPADEAGGRDVGALIGAGVLDWLHGTLSGFTPGRDLSESHNAFRHLVIQPRPPMGIAFGEATGEPPVRAVEAAVDTINGRYESAWQLTDHAFELAVVVPGNCSAEVVLPDATGHEVEAGRHEFRMEFGEAGDGIPVLREVS